LAKIIPYRGSWVEFEYDTKNLLYVRIDRKRKFLATIFLRALGLILNLDINKWKRGEMSDSELEESIKFGSYSDGDILRTFYTTNKIHIRDGKLWLAVTPSIIDMKVSTAVTDPKTGDTLVKAGRKISASALENLQRAKLTEIAVDILDLEGAFVVDDIVNGETGEVIIESNEELNARECARIIEAGVIDFSIFFPERDEVGVVISQTLKKDTVKLPRDALLEIYRKMRPGDPPTIGPAWNLFFGMFFDDRKFDFSRVGRLKFNI
jgi:DNA-directed RNA polymerase subunit beta